MEPAAEETAESAGATEDEAGGEAGVGGAGDEEWPTLASSLPEPEIPMPVQREVTAALRWLEDEWDPAMAEDALALNDAEEELALQFVQELTSDGEGGG